MHAQQPERRAEHQEQPVTCETPIAEKDQRHEQARQRDRAVQKIVHPSSQIKPISIKTRETSALALRQISRSISGTTKMSMNRMTLLNARPTKQRLDHSSSGVL